MLPNSLLGCPMASGYYQVLRGDMHCDTAQATGLHSSYLCSGEGACHIRLGHSKLEYGVHRGAEARLKNESLTEKTFRGNCSF